MAATKAPSTLPVGFVKASVARNASSIVPAPTSASMSSRPSVAAARGIGARPSTASQNGPDRCAITSLLSRGAAVRPLQPRDVDLLHLEHRVHDPLRLRGIGIAEHLAEHRGRDLPGQPVPVLEPAARALLAAGGQPVPVVVHLVL